jgi:hypothetical protein
MGGFLNFCKAFASSGEIGEKISHSLHMWAGGGQAEHDFLRFGLPAHMGFSGENLFTDTCSSQMQLPFLFKQATSKVKMS